LKPHPLPLTGAVLAALYAALRIFHPHLPVTDTVLQLALLVPASVCLSLHYSRRIRRDLLRKAEGMLMGLSSEVFLGTILLILGGFFVWMAYGPLEGIPKGSDESAYYFQSRIYAAGQLEAPVPEVPDPMAHFPFRHFIFRDGGWFIVYTPMHSLLMAPFSAAGLAPLTGPFAGLLSLLGVFLLIRLWAEEKLARACTLLLALSPYYLFMTPTFMAHNSNLMLVSWGLLALSRRIRGGEWGWGAAGGLLFGMALMTKPYPVTVWILLLPLAAAALFRGKWLKTFVPAAAAALLPVAVFILMNRHYTGSFFKTGYQLVGEGKLLGFGTGRAWFPDYGGTMHTPLRGFLNVMKQIREGSVMLFGWPYLSLIPMTLPLLFSKRNRRVLWLYVPLALMLVMMWLHSYPAVDYGPRHYYTFLPVVILLSALGIKRGFELARNRWGVRGTNSLFMVMGTLLAMDLFLYIPEGIDVRRGPRLCIDDAPAAAAREYADPPALVFMQAGQHGYPHICSGLNHTSPFLSGEIIYCAHQTPEEDMTFMALFPGRNPYLMWHDGEDFAISEWDSVLAARVQPTREMEYLTYLRIPGSNRITQ